MSATLVAPLRGAPRKGEYPPPQFYLNELAERWVNLTWSEKFAAYLDDESTFQSLEECAQGPKYCVTCDAETFSGDERLNVCGDCDFDFNGPPHPSEL